MKWFSKKLSGSFAALALAFGIAAAMPQQAHAATYLCILQGCDSSYCYYNCYRISAD